MADGRIRLTWLPRSPALEPRAVAALGATAQRLGRRLRELAAPHLARLSAVAGEDLLLVLGEGSDLPWVEGVIYLGRSTAAPSLLLPTHALPGAGEALFERAVLRRHKGLAPPIAVLPDRALFVSAACALALDRAALDRYLDPGQRNAVLARPMDKTGEAKP